MFAPWNTPPIAILTIPHLEKPSTPWPKMAGWGSLPPSHLEAQPVPPPIWPCFSKKRAIILKNSDCGCSEISLMVAMRCSSTAPKNKSNASCLAPQRVNFLLHLHCQNPIQARTLQRSEPAQLPTAMDSSSMVANSGHREWISPTMCCWPFAPMTWAKNN